LEQSAWEQEKIALVSSFTSTLLSNLLSPLPSLQDPGVNFMLQPAALMARVNARETLKLFSLISLLLKGQI